MRLAVMIFLAVVAATDSAFADQWMLMGMGVSSSSTTTPTGNILADLGSILLVSNGSNLLVGP